jgi:hypothetical protein
VRHRATQTLEQVAHFFRWRMDNALERLDNVSKKGAPLACFAPPWWRALKRLIFKAQTPCATCATFLEILRI